MKKKKISFFKMKTYTDSYDLYKKYFPEVDIYMRKTMKRKGKFLIIAKSRRKLVGCVGVTRDLKNKNEYRLLWIIVHPKYRRQGIGRKLKFKAILESLNDGAKKVSMVAFKGYDLDIDDVIKYGFEKFETKKFNFYSADSNKIKIEKIEGLLNE